MAKAKFPRYSIPDLKTETPGKDVLNVDRFSKYLLVNPHLHGPHAHTFYHLVYFTKGRGSQVIDFTKVPVRPGIIYFMNPAQIHQWMFDGETDGYIVNFSAIFFEELLISSQIVQGFDFFSGSIGDQVILLSKPAQKKVTAIFESILVEQGQKKKSVTLMIASQLLQLFITIQRDTGSQTKNQTQESRHVSLFRNFNALVDKYYKDKRLPKEYAELLFVTTHQLNAIAQEVAGISSGEVIRNRIILEAKRLLVNIALPVEEIAGELGFEDSSYFIKFFKKYTSLTPEKFRITLVND